MSSFSDRCDCEDEADRLELVRLAGLYPKAFAAGANLGNLQRLERGTVLLAGGTEVTKAHYDRIRGAVPR